MTAILMLQTAVFIVSLCLLVSLIGNIILYSKCEEIRAEKDKVSKEKDKIKREKDKADAFKKDLIAIEPGHKVIYPDYGLTYTDTDKDGNKMTAIMSADNAKAQVKAGNAKKGAGW